MNNQIPNIPSLFEAIKQTEADGVVYWKARDLSKALGYAEFRNFAAVLQKAMEVCRNNANSIDDHIVEFNEMVELGSGAFREVRNLKLSKYACLLVAMNANNKRDVVLQAQAYDYDSKAATTQEFYKKVQNKLHWAITHKTAAEIISERADANKPKMGLMTWKQAPKGKILKSDALIAKNYLSEDEISNLNLISTSLLDFAEGQARRGIVMTMDEWAKKLDAYLELSNYKVLLNSDSISADQAKQKAETEYEIFQKKQDTEWISDFDVEIRKFIDEK